MPDDPLRHLAKESAELIAVLDRGDALRQALALLIDESEVAWAAWPTGTDTLRIEHLVGNKTTRLQSLPVPPGAGLTGKVYASGQLERVDDYFASPLGGSLRVVPDPDGGTIWQARLPC